jgi:hypothetical protein
VGKDALADKVKPADDSDDDSDEEHLEDHGDTAVLLRELEKNRREGAPADQARPDASAAASRETWLLRRRTRCWASSLPSVKIHLWVGVRPYLERSPSSTAGLMVRVPHGLCYDIP